MKKILSTLSALLLALSMQADGGMWFLQLMEEQHLADSLKKAGLKMKVKDLYSNNGMSLKDCIGQFGGGCTAEVISPDGLILTNNHCGYSYVHAMSTLEKNYLKDGYFAKSRAEEIPVPELDFTFVIAVKDVTDFVLEKAKENGVDEFMRQTGYFLRQIAGEVKENSSYKDDTSIEASITAFYGGNRFYAFFTQTFRDVRLVVNPPLNVAQFGGDGDNWIWPRHNPDFAIFRVYANADGKPADYSPENIPLHRDKYLPISLKGYNEGDFAMIMGFPGRTSRYLSASQLQTVMDCQYTPIVKVGEPILKLNREMMAESDSMRLAMADEHMGLQNTVKNFGGAVEAVKKTRLVEQKRRMDAALTAYGKKIGNEDYANVVARIDALNRAYADTLHDAVLYSMTMGRISQYISPSSIQGYISAARTGDSTKVATALETLKKAYEESGMEADMKKDLRRTPVIFPIWEKNCRLSCNRNDDNLRSDIEDVLTKSLFRSRETFDEFMANPDTLTLQNDPLYKWQSRPRPAFLMSMGGYSRQNSLLSQTYQRGIMDMNGWTTPPDANFTQRLTYGHVKGYSPRDAVNYDYKTELKGMFEKESPADPDYVVNPKVRSLYNSRTFGTYANKEGRMQTDFLTDNDITGGNSGSPVLNARGELIGVAFDGNIESLSSDFQYNPQLQRCINADIRYVLWTVDVFGGSSYILKELDIRR